MQNFYNGISPTIRRLFDAATCGILMSKMVDDAKSIIKHMATGSSACQDLDSRPKKKLEDTA